MRLQEGNINRISVPPVIKKEPSYGRQVFMCGRGGPKTVVEHVRRDSINRNRSSTSIADSEPDIDTSYGGNFAVNISGDDVSRIDEHRSEEQNKNNTQPSNQRGKKKKRRKVRF